METSYLLYDPLATATFGPQDPWYADNPQPVNPGSWHLPRGGLLKWTWLDGNATATYLYDVANRLERVEQSFGWQRWIYDERNRLLRYEGFDNTSDRTIRLESTYDDLGRLRLESGFDEGWLRSETSFDYDSAGNMVAYEIDGGLSGGPDGTPDAYAVYTYDDEGRVRTAEDNLGNRGFFLFDDRGRPVGERWWISAPRPYWMCFDWTFDDADRVLSEVLGCFGEIETQELYSYDERGNLLQIETSVTASGWRETDTWTYDDQDRRLTYVYEGFDGSMRESEAWTYTEGVPCSLDNEWRSSHRSAGASARMPVFPREREHPWLTGRDERLRPRPLWGRSGGQPGATFDATPPPRASPRPVTPPARGAR